MSRAGGVVLAGGRSVRMGAPKAGLEWHGSTLLRRVAGLLERGVDGPVVVVGAPGVALPDLPGRFRVLEDPVAGRGPQQGLAVGLAALAGAAELAFVAATDLPFLHPDFVRSVLAALDAQHDIALPELDGHHQPFAAAYRTSLAPVAAQLVAAERLKPAFLQARARVRRLGPGDLARPESVRNLNEPGDYEAARAEPPPRVVVTGHGTVRAATLGAAARAAGVPLAPGRDPEDPLAGGDEVDPAAA